MPTLENDSLVFRFPQIDGAASVSINFQRTLRIPDTDKVYPLPPGLGSFSLRHADDYADRLPQATHERGGAIMPIWQAEAMWLSFNNWAGFPVAIKIAAGKINAVTGEAWRSNLHRDPQDYVVSPDQMWLDGFAVEKGVIRQFVAMPLGEGYSAEEQLTGQATWGGLQISVTPLKAAVWEKLKRLTAHYEMACAKVVVCKQMSLAPGGKMHQEIYPDTFDLADWDTDATERVFVTLVHAKDWKSVTGAAPATFPPSAEAYSNAGLPWFDFYGVDQGALEGSETLAQLGSLAEQFKEKTGVSLPDSEDVQLGEPIQIKSIKPAFRPIRSSDF